MKAGRTITISALVVGLTALAACNTVEGVGKDVSAGGQAITKGADNTQKAITQ